MVVFIVFYPQKKVNFRILDTMNFDYESSRAK